MTGSVEAPDGDELVDAAGLRVEQFLSDLDRIGIEDVGLVSLPATDMAARAPARSAAVKAAEEAGLGPLQGEARDEARARVVRMYDRNIYQPTWAGLNWGRSLGTIEDRVAVAAAVEDAMIGTVALDVVSADVANELLEPMRLLIAMHPTDAPPSPFAGPGWTRRLGAVLALVFSATMLLALGVYFGTIGWVAWIVILAVLGLLVLRGRSAT